MANHVTYLLTSCLDSQLSFNSSNMMTLLMNLIISIKLTSTVIDREGQGEANNYDRDDSYACLNAYGKL